MKSKMILINAVYFIISLVIFLYLFQIFQWKQIVIIIGILAILMMVIIIYTWIRLTGSLLNLFMFFLLFLIIFNFGQFIAMVLNGFNMTILQSYTNVLTAFSSDVLLKSTIITYFSIFCLHIGGLLSYKKYKFQFCNYNEIHLSYCKYIGIILFIISIIPTVIYDYTYFSQSINIGYSLSELSVNYGIIDDLTRLFKISIIFLLIGYKNSKKSKIIFCISILYSIIKIWIIGQRGYEFIFIIIITYIYYKYISMLNLKKLLRLILISVVLLSMMNSIVYIRETTNKVSIDQVINNIAENNIIIEILSEFGSTFYTTELIINNVPQTINFGYGVEYASAFLSIFPNIGNLNQHLNNVNIIYQVKPFVEDGIGIGGSFIGEAYYNFSYLIFIFMIFAGYLFFYVYSTIKNKKGNIDFIKVCLILAFYQNLIWLIRDNVMSFPRKCLLEILFPYLIYIVLKKINNSHIKRAKILR